MLREASQVYPQPRLKLAVAQKFVEQDHELRKHGLNWEGFLFRRFRRFSQMFPASHLRISAPSADKSAFP